MKKKITCDYGTCDKKAIWHFVTEGTQLRACRVHYCKEHYLKQKHAFTDGVWGNKCIKEYISGIFS